MEALLRPVVEYQIAATAIGSSLIVALGPELLMLTPSVAYGSSLVLGAYGIYWIWRGNKILAYQYNLNRLKVYKLKSSEIPVSDEKLFLGRGFAWREYHTQRLHDTGRTRFAPFVNRKSLMDRWRAYRNPNMVTDLGGLSALHGVELNETDISLRNDDRNGHLWVLGTTRVGKTRLLEILAAQDIRRGEVVIVFDPKGDGDLLKRIYNECRAANRLDDLVVFHLGYPEASARYNGVGQYSRITEVASRIAGQLSGEGQSAVFKEFAWRFVNIVAKAMEALGQTPNYRSIQRHVTNIADLYVEYCEDILSRIPEGIQKLDARHRILDNPERPKDTGLMADHPSRVRACYDVVNDLAIEDDVLEGLTSAFRYERSYFDKIVASLLPLLEKLTTGKSAQLLAPDYLDTKDNRPIFDWRSVVNTGGVVYVGLDALTDAPVASAVGNSMFADLVSLAGERYKHGDINGLRSDSKAKNRKICIHADEFNELMGDEFIPMINKGGGAGLQISAYTQTFSDIQARIGSEAKTRQVAGNFNNIIMLRVKDIDTARLLTDQLPNVDVNNITFVSGYNDSSDTESDVDFTSRHEDRITTVTAPMLEPHMLMKLPKGQCFGLLEGGRLYKIRLPLPEQDDNDVDTPFDQVIKDMISRYRTSEAWWSVGGAR
jgi:conjugative coupling factor TraD (TOL family)